MWDTCLLQHNLIGFKTQVCWLSMKPDSLKLFDIPEPDLLEVEGVLDDAGGGHPDAQDVLLGADVVREGYPVYVR